MTPEQFSGSPTKMEWRSQSSKLSLYQRFRLRALSLVLNKREFSLLPFSRRGFLLEEGWFESVLKKQSIKAGGSPVPWITYPALKFLDQRLPTYARVFEYGAGNSTLYFHTRGLEVYSAEHDEKWYRLMAPKLPFPERMQLHPLTSDASRDAYVYSIKEPGIRFDIIFIDGRLRRKCLLHAATYLKEGGVVILDNAERSYYQEGVEHLHAQGFRQLDFWGLSPINYRASCTTVFYKTANLLGI